MMKDPGSPSDSGGFLVDLLRCGNMRLFHQTSLHVFSSRSGSGWVRGWVTGLKGERSTAWVCECKRISLPGSCAEISDHIPTAPKRIVEAAYILSEFCLVSSGVFQNVATVHVRISEPLKRTNIPTQAAMATNQQLHAKNGR